MGPSRDGWKRGACVRWFVGGCGLVVSGVILGLAAGCRPNPERTDAHTGDPAARSNAVPLGVRLTNATERPIPRYLRVTGQLQGMQDALVAADTAGKVIEAPIERGSLVSGGGVLVKVDARTAALSLDEAAAAVSLAQARLALANNETDRNAPLVKTRAIAEADFRKLEADQAVREADLASALARRELARKSLADCVIRAPFAGLVVERLVQPGEYVRVDTPIARVVEVSRLRLVLNIPETAVGSIREGQAVEFSTAAFPGATFTGTIRFIGGAIRESARDLIVEAEVANADGRLKPGLFAEARVRLSDARAVTIPSESLRIDGSRRSVFLLENGTLVERLVEIGESLDGWVEIRRGVQAGEAVVFAPERAVADGLPAKASQP